MGEQRRARGLRILRMVVTLVSVILLWQLATLGLHIPTYLLPSPLDLVQAVGKHARELLMQMAPTLIEMVSGFIIGNLAAILLAVWFVYSPVANTAFMPIAIALRSLPIVAITPVLTLVLGTGYATTITVVSLVVLFPTLVNAVKGLRSVDRRALDLLDVVAATPGQVFWYLRLPVMLPYLFSALRVTAPASALGALVAEWVASNRGLGFLIVDAQYKWEIPLLWAAALSATFLAVAAFSAVGMVQKRTLRWHDSSREQ